MTAGILYSRTQSLQLKGSPTERLTDVRLKSRGSTATRPGGVADPQRPRPGARDLACPAHRQAPRHPEHRCAAEHRGDEEWLQLAQARVATLNIEHVDVQNKIIADALNYAIASAPDAVKGLGLDEAALAEKLRARLAPAVLAPPPPTDR